MSHTPLLSLCIPTYNRSQSLRYVLEKFVENAEFNDEVEGTSEVGAVASSIAWYIPGITHRIVVVGDAFAITDAPAQSYGTGNLHIDASDSFHPVVVAFHIACLIGSLAAP